MQISSKMSQHKLAFLIFQRVDNGLTIELDSCVVELFGITPEWPVLVLVFKGIETSAQASILCERLFAADLESHESNIILLQAICLWLSLH